MPRRRRRPNTSALQSLPSKTEFGLAALKLHAQKTRRKAGFSLSAQKTGPRTFETVMPSFCCSPMPISHIRLLRPCERHNDIMYKHIPGARRRYLVNMMETTKIATKTSVIMTMVFLLIFSTTITSNIILKTADSARGFALYSNKKGQELPNEASTLSYKT